MGLQQHKHNKAIMVHHFYEKVMEYIVQVSCRENFSAILIYGENGTYSFCVRVMAVTISFKANDK